MNFVEPAVCLGSLLTGLILHHWWGIRTGDPEIAVPWFVVLAYVVSFIAGGTATLLEALRDLKRGRVSIDLLMIVAALGAAILKDWPEGAVLLFLFSLSHSLEHFILGRTRSAIAGLMKLTPDEAVVLRDGVEQTIRVEDLKIGDVVLVHPSDRIPIDGRIRNGRTTVDQSPMTGESVPVEKQVGDGVLAGTLNQQGLIQVEVTRIAGETTLARMVRLVEHAQSERASSQQFTDWFGQRYTIAVLMGTVGTLLLGHYVLGDTWDRAFHRAMTALVVASPCAVVISIPAAILSAIAGAARGGVLFKGGSHLERTALLRAIAFDKTGTLTIGRPQLTSILVGQGVSENELLAIAAVLESHSKHPLARSIVDAAVARGISLPQIDDVEEVVGHGIIGRIDGRQRRIGKLKWLRESGISIADDLSCRASELQSDGQTLIGVSGDDTLIGLLAVSDSLRSSAAPAMKELKRLGLQSLVMLSGDHPTVAARIAGQLGMEGEGGLLPEDKLNRLADLKQKFDRVGMIGDGMNDAPSLAAASVGFSLGGAGTDVALETADVVLMADDLMKLPYAVALSRETQRIIRQNLIIAFATMGVLLIATFVTELPLPLAVFGHEGSTVVVILNGLRLLWFRHVPQPD